MPLDVATFSPSVWATALGYFSGEGTQAFVDVAIDIMLPLWTRYKAYANEQGIGAHDATRDAAIRQKNMKGYHDYGFLGAGFFNASSDAQREAGSIFITRMAVTREVKIRKWIE